MPELARAHKTEDHQMKQKRLTHFNRLLALVDNSPFPIMNKTALRLGLVLGLIAFNSTLLLADVVITMPTGGNNMSADKALNSTNGAAFTALGNIVITEGLNTDFANGTGQTLILTLPDGWRFNAGVGTVTFTAVRNLSAAT